MPINLGQGQSSPPYFRLIFAPRQQGSAFPARTHSHAFSHLRSSAAQGALPTSSLGRACSYATDLWPGLRHFLNDPVIPLDNNATERALRAVAVRRKNHYRSRSERGTQVAAVFYALVESVRLLGIDPRRYLREATLRAIDNPGTLTLPRDLLGDSS